LSENGILGASELIHNLAHNGSGIIGSLFNIGAPVLLNVLAGIVAGAAFLLGVAAAKNSFWWSNSLIPHVHPLA
jgi:hypothetical protein